MSPLAPTPSQASATRATRWDRAAVIALGAAGCALSYDALQQMAVAIHVRGPLTYLFPAVIDGFIAYSVRALIITRAAAFRARMYVWTLFSIATAASIWANALRAVRLNQLAGPDGGLHLGDGAVAVLSTLAPLALAGAVHLHILIARGPANASTSDAPGHSGQAERLPVSRTGRPGQDLQSVAQPAAGDRAAALTVANVQDSDRATRFPVRLGTGAGSGSEAQGPDHELLPDTASAQARKHPGDRTSEQSGKRDGASVTGSGGVRRQPQDTKTLLEIARRAVKAEDKLTRKVVAQAIRGQQIQLSNERLTALMVQLRADHGQLNAHSPD